MERKKQLSLFLLGVSGLAIATVFAAQALIVLGTAMLTSALVVAVLKILGLVK